MFEPVTYTTLPPEVAIPVGVTKLSVTAAREVNVSALLTKLPFCFTFAPNTAAVDTGSSVTISAELTKWLEAPALASSDKNAESRMCEPEV
jgi:hypothetical protein